MKPLLRAAFVCALAISAFAIFATVNAQTYSLSDVVQLSQRVYVELRDLDKAGANVTELAARYNTALNLIDQAERLDSSGDHADASVLAGQAESILQSVASDGENLNVGAPSSPFAHRVVVVPIEAFLIALVVAGFVIFRKRAEFKKITEMRVVAK